MGLIGATTPEPALISHFGEMGIDVVVPAVQAEIDAPLAQGTSRIIRGRHLQRVQQGLAPMPVRDGADIVAAGGSDGLPAHAG